jgi:hypothetical protein
MTESYSASIFSARGAGSLIVRPGQDSHVMASWRRTASTISRWSALGARQRREAKGRLRRPPGLPLVFRRAGATLAVIAGSLPPATSASGIAARQGRDGPSSLGRRRGATRNAQEPDRRKAVTRQTIPPHPEPSQPPNPYPIMGQDPGDPYTQPLSALDRADLQPAAQPPRPQRLSPQSPRPAGQQSLPPFAPVRSAE